MAYQIALAAPYGDGFTRDAGLAFNGNAWETRALAEYVRARAYGANDCWSIVINTDTQQASIDDRRVAVEFDDDVPF